jgi:hypothetical protein
MNNAFGFGDKAMENDFDFDSAASSPSLFGAGPVDIGSPEMPTIKYDTPCKSSPNVRTKFRHHTKMNSVRILMLSLATFLFVSRELTCF